MTAIPATFRLRREGALRSRAARGDAVGLRGGLRAPSPGAVSLLPLDPAPRGGRAGRVAEHVHAGVRGVAGRAARLRAAAVAVPDRPQRGDLDPAPPRRATDELADVAGRAPIEDRIAEREELRVLQLDLAELPERQRAALVLRELNGPQPRGDRRRARALGGARSSRRSSRLAARSSAAARGVRWRARRQADAHGRRRPRAARPRPARAPARVRGLQPLQGRPPSASACG